VKLQYNLVSLSGATMPSKSQVPVTCLATRHVFLSITCPVKDWSNSIPILTKSWRWTEILAWIWKFIDNFTIEIRMQGSSEYWNSTAKNEKLWDINKTNLPKKMGEKRKRKSKSFHDFCFLTWTTFFHIKRSLPQTAKLIHYSWSYHIVEAGRISSSKAVANDNPLATKKDYIKYSLCMKEEGECDMVLHDSDCHN